jgi:hypothetical protein
MALIGVFRLDGGNVKEVAGASFAQVGLEVDLVSNPPEAPGRRRSHPVWTKELNRPPTHHAVSR